MTNSILADQLSRAIRRKFESMGLKSRHSLYVAETLVTTSLRGIDTHGVELLPIYIKEIEKGRSLINPRFSWATRNGGSGVLDAGAALGVVAGNVGMRAAMARAKIHGVSGISVKNSNHFGAAGYYSQLAASRGYLALVLSNSDALVAPFNGLLPLNGTNPIAFAAAGMGDDYFHLDMATSQTSFSKLRRALERNLPITPGTALDPNGADSSLSRELAVLCPLGGYKGQGLGMMVQLLCAILPGEPPDHKLSNLFTAPFNEPRRVGHFIFCLDIHRFQNLTAFRQGVSNLLAEFRSSKSISTDAVIVPGDREKSTFCNRLKNGIPISIEAIRQIESFF